MKGVTYCKNRDGRWRYKARCHHNKKDVFIGFFDTEKEAAKAYDMYVIKNSLDKPTNYIKKL